MREEASHNYEKAVVISDIHLPFEDKKALSLLYQFLKSFKPDILFILGDFIDCLTISKFPVPPNNVKHLVDECQAGREVLSIFRKILGKQPRIVYIYGNHEYRLQSYIISRCRDLWGLEGLSIQDQLHSDEYDVEVVTQDLKENYYQYGKLYLGHFNKASKYTIFNLVEQRGVSICQAHTHKLRGFYKRLFNDVYLGGWETGCLCSLEPSWMLKPDWQHGITIIYKEKIGNHFFVEQIPIIDYKFFYGGKLYQN